MNWNLQESVWVNLEHSVHWKKQSNTESAIMWSLKTDNSLSPPNSTARTWRPLHSFFHECKGAYSVHQQLILSVSGFCIKKTFVEWLSCAHRKIRQWFAFFSCLPSMICLSACLPVAPFREGPGTWMIKHWIFISHAAIWNFMKVPSYINISNLKLCNPPKLGVFSYHITVLADISKYRYSHH